MLQMKGDLVRRQIHLEPSLDNLELDHHKLTRALERDQAIRDAEPDPTFDSG
jgi:hypothetical protein